MMEGHEHRKKAKHNRNGRNRYEKGQHLYGEAPKHITSRYHAGGPLERGKLPPLATLRDVWPRT